MSEKKLSAMTLDELAKYEKILKIKILEERLERLHLERYHPPSSLPEISMQGLDTE